MKTKPILFKINTKGCFVCVNHCRTNGYPRKLHNGKKFIMSRMIWEESFGEIPNGLYVLHRCDNRACINPEHLFLGTQADNNRDMINKGREKHPRNEFCGNAKLTKTDKSAIRHDHILFRRSLARKYNVNIITIDRILKKMVY